MYSDLTVNIYALSSFTQHTTKRWIMRKYRKFISITFSFFYFIKYLFSKSSDTFHIDETVFLCCDTRQSLEKFKFRFTGKYSWTFSNLPVECLKYSHCYRFGNLSGANVMFVILRNGIHFQRVWHMLKSQWIGKYMPCNLNATHDCSMRHK